MSEAEPPTPPQQGQPPATQQQPLPPISHPFPGSLTPGWNDPPSIQYSPQSTGAAGRTKLNKRVPFPLQQNANTTKPTAIVQPCQAPPSGSNIAVVYPIQYANQGMPPHTARIPTLPPSMESTPTLLGECIQTTSTTLPTVPTMSVAAMPRQNTNDVVVPSASASASASSASIQHL